MQNAKDFIFGKNLGYIDVLRAIAILMVILIHTGQTVHGLSGQIASLTEYGQMGVQLFFVTSAYTLCLSHVRRNQEQKQLTSFFIRRVFRIAPLYYIAIAWYFLVEPLTGILKAIKDPDFTYTFSSVLANAFLLNGFVISANNNVVPGGWSVGVEISFYLFFPLIFSLFSWVNRRFGLIGLYSLVGFSVLLNIVLQIIIWKMFSLDIVHNSFIYRCLINQLPVFLLGMMIFFQHQNGIKIPLPIIIQGLIFASLTVVLELCFVSKNTWMLTLVPFGAGISFVFLLNILRELNYSNKLLEKVGQVSFSMYILHFNFVWYLTPGLMSNFDKIVEPHLLLIFAFIVSVASSFLIANFSYKYIELPAINLGKKLIAQL
jgi:peptidoglycan/LPS O-acetylase OafA/YrhL